MHPVRLNRETWSGVLCSETLIRRCREDLFLKETRIIARSGKIWPGDSLKLRRCLDRRTSRRQKSRLTMKSSRWKICSCIRGSMGQGDRHSSRQIDPAHRLGSTNEGEWSEIAMCTEGFRDDSERWRICANSIPMVSAWTFCCTQHGLFFLSGNWRPCVCFQASRLVLWSVRSTSEKTRTWWMDLETTWNGMRTANRDFTEFLAGVLTEHMGFKRGKLERCLFVHESNETRVVSHGDDPHICAKPATPEKFWMQITKLVVIKREEALNHPRSCGLPGIRVPMCTRRWTQRIHSETYRRVHGRMPGHCRTQRQWWRLWRNRRAWIYQVQRSLFRAVVGKLQYITGVRPDLMFVTNACHTKLHHRHLQTWHVPRKRWDIWKEHVNWISTWQYLHCYRLTWTRPWNTSRDALMLTGLVTQWRGKAHLALCVSLTTFSWRANVEDRVALSSGESELYALGALSAELIFAQAVLKEIGLSFLIHARADSSTARAVATKQGASRKMKHIHTRFLFIQDLVFRSWCEPERHRDESALTRAILQIEIDAWYRDRAVIKTSCKQNVWWSGRVE